MYHSVSCNGATQNERRIPWKQKFRQLKHAAQRSLASWRKSRLRNSQSTVSAGFTKMAAAGIKLHPSCRARQEGFGLLFYDCRGPRLLFAATGSLLHPDFFTTVRERDELPEGLSTGEKGVLQRFIAKLLEKGFLREQ